MYENAQVGEVISEEMVKEAKVKCVENERYYDRKERKTQGTKNEPETWIYAFVPLSGPSPVVPASRLSDVVRSERIATAKPFLLFLLYTWHIWVSNKKMNEIIQKFSFHFPIFIFKCVKEVTPLMAPNLRWVKVLITNK